MMAVMMREEKERRRGGGVADGDEWGKELEEVR